MSARLTPEAVANRELERLAARESRALAELQAIDAERASWAAVLRAVNGDHQHDDAVEAE